MTTDEVRAKFLAFFKSKGHTIVESDSLVPKDDPTVLFTTAGMQQFKRQFLGHIEGYTKAASSQKCLRTDDLEEVGRTPYHHTFFEMLGNFSFGDYFKKEAIEWGWEFLTKDLKIPAKKLWVSVYEDDEEAYNIWLKTIKVPEDKIVKLGDKSNFWPAEAKTKGPNGPCGPCSEIFYDYGVNKDCKNKNCNPDCSCGRFSEVWNLVFTQFNRKEGGVLEPLPNKNIDTGMGLERLAAVVQGKKSNYETDLFAPIIDAIYKEAIQQKIILDPVDMRVIADHIRAIVFAINDGVIPSNKARGSVVKRLITDPTDLILTRYGKPFIHKLIPIIVKIMKSTYQDLKEKEKIIVSHVKKVEIDYENLYQTKIPELRNTVIRFLKSEDANSKLNRIKALGEVAFKYRDTYGLTLPTIALTMSKAGVLDEDYLPIREEFLKHMKQQQERSRMGSKILDDVFADADLDLDVPQTKFLGYDELSSRGKILKLFINDQEVKQISQGDTVKVVLDQTPFYPEAGGQIGDTGTIKNKNGSVNINDTQKIADVIIHFGEVANGELKVAESVEVNVDDQRRLSIMRNHTATHLLQSALRETLGTHVQQQGSLVAEDRLRFDFTHPKALTKDQLAQIENKITKHIADKDKVVKEEMSLEEAKKQGALAFFAEKYKDQVRVISIGNYSKEFCGGTHLDSTGDIGRFIISSEGAVAQGIRRLEARTGTGADEFIKQREKKDRKRKQLQEKRNQELQDKKAADKQRLEDFKSNLKTIVEKADSINKTKIVTHMIPDADTNQLKNFSDLIKQQVSSVAVCLGSTPNGSAAVVVSVSDDLVKKGIKANELIKDIAPLIGGSGGGRPQLAQAGSKDVNKVKKALGEAKQLIKDTLR